MLAIPCSDFSVIWNAGSQEVQPSSEHTDICSNHEQCEARCDQIKTTKSFLAKESVKGHMASPLYLFFFFDTKTLDNIYHIILVKRSEYDYWRCIMTCRLMLLEVLSYLKTYLLMLSCLNWMTLWMNSELLVRMVNSQVDPVIRDAFMLN